MDLRSGILSTANSLGMDPNWLAGIISYETAGTFDPTKAGPTTQWGQHRGLIQFGEPQAQQYGVDWNNPIGSQLGPDGAVAKYFRDRGWQPGMSLEQAYSIVNAGAPNRLNASDANNGGAPGTVAEKVRNQFAPHMAKGAALLGGEGNDTLQARASTQGAPMGLFDSFTGNQTGTPFIPGQSQEEPQRFGDRLRAAASDGSLWDGLALAANSLSHSPDPQLAAMVSQRQQGREDAKRKNRTVEWMRANGMGDLAGAVESGALSAQQAIEYASEQRAQQQALEQQNATLAWLEQQPNGAQYAEAVRAGVLTPADAYREMTGGGDVGTVVMGDRLVNEQTGEVIADFTGAAGPDVKGESDLRKEYTGNAATKEFDTQVSAYSRILESGREPSAAGDLAMIFNYMKLLDPGSVVRESEFRTAQDAAAWVTKSEENGIAVPRPVATAIQRIQTGQMLLPEQRGDFMKRAEMLYYGAERQQKAREGEYRKIAEDYNYNPERAVPSLGYVSDGLPSSPRPQQRGAPPPAPPVPAPVQQAEQAPAQYTVDDFDAAISQLSDADVTYLQSLPDSRTQIEFLKAKGVLK